MRIRSSSIYYDGERRELVEKRLLGKRRVHIDAISGVELRRLPSLYDELGLLLFSDQNEFLVRETQEIFQELKTRLQFDKLFGEDWYQRAEAGEVIRAKLNER